MSLDDNSVAAKAMYEHMLAVVDMELRNCQVVVRLLTQSVVAQEDWYW